MAADAVRRFAVKTASLQAKIVQLSGGNQQKVVLGRWFALSPDVIVLSEPTRGIDVGAKSEIYRLIQDMAAGGAGILIVSSELPELLGLCDRILVMFRGRITAEFDAGAVTEEEIAHAALRRGGRRGGRMTTAVESQEPSGRLRDLRSLRRLSLGRYTGVLLGFAVIFVYLSITEPVFLTWGNWQNIIRSQAVVLTLGIGMTFVVLTGGIDLSIASATAGAAMILGIVVARRRLVVARRPRRASASGFAFGLANGLMIGILKIPFFVVTLGTLSIYQSIALLSTSGETVSLFTYPRFNEIPTLINGSVGPVPTVLLFGGGAVPDRCLRPALHGVRPRRLRGRLQPRGGPADRDQGHATC